MPMSVTMLRNEQEWLREMVADRFDIYLPRLENVLFFRSGTHRVSLGRASELPIKSMPDEALFGPWCHRESSVVALSASAMHFLRPYARVNVLSLGIRQAELFLGCTPLAVETNQDTTTPGCVIVEHGPSILGIGWVLDHHGQLTLQRSGSEAPSFREEPERHSSIQIHLPNLQALFSEPARATPSYASAPECFR